MYMCTCLHVVNVCVKQTWRMLDLYHLVIFSLISEQRHIKLLKLGNISLSLYAFQNCLHLALWLHQLQIWIVVCVWEKYKQRERERESEREWKPASERGRGRESERAGESANSQSGWPDVSNNDLLSSFCCTKWPHIFVSCRQMGGKREVQFAGWAA